MESHDVHIVSHQGKVKPQLDATMYLSGKLKFLKIVRTPNAGEDVEDPDH